MHCKMLMKFKLGRIRGEAVDQGSSFREGLLYKINTFVSVQIFPSCDPILEIETGTFQYITGYEPLSELMPAKY